MRCAVCGEPYGSDALFCPACGALVRVTEPLPVPGGSLPVPTPRGQAPTVERHHVLPERNRQTHPAGLVAAVVLVALVAVAGLVLARQADRPQLPTPQFADVDAAVALLAARGLACPVVGRVTPLTRTCGDGLTVSLWADQDAAVAGAQAAQQAQAAAGRSGEYVVLGNALIVPGTVRIDAIVDALAGYDPVQVR